PYSKFPVGAALLAEDDSIITGMTELKNPGSPCGMCRQFLIEFGNYKIIPEDFCRYKPMDNLNRIMIGEPW
ncbi:hypothetical protein ANCDUO_08083, partial [Ancylostoma duodenale]